MDETGRFVVLSTRHQSVLKTFPVKRLRVTGPPGGPIKTVARAHISRKQHCALLAERAAKTYGKWFSERAIISTQTQQIGWPPCAKQSLSKQNRGECFGWFDWICFESVYSSFFFFWFGSVCKRVRIARIRYYVCARFVLVD